MTKSDICYLFWNTYYRIYHNIDSNIIINKLIIMIKIIKGNKI